MENNHEALELKTLSPTDIQIIIDAKLAYRKARFTSFVCRTLNPISLGRNRRNSWKIDRAKVAEAYIPFLVDINNSRLSEQEGV